VAEMNRALADFLRRARDQVDPVTAGLPADGRVRRVQGLRREEVALLAGVSTDYYARLEQGRPIHPTPGVLDALARALDLGEAGRAHLEHLVGATSRRRSSRPLPVQRVRKGLHQLLENLTGAPALVLGRRTDVLASNRMAHALLTDFSAMRPQERSYARWMFLGREPRELFSDWEVQARAAVESLRLDQGRHPGEPGTERLVAELSEASPEFDRWWTEHRVHQRTHGSKLLRHPVVGALTVDYETLTMPGDDDQTLFVYSTPAGSASREAMDLLASWTLADDVRHGRQHQ